MLWLLINRVILIAEGIIYCHEYDHIKVGDIMDQYVIALILGIWPGFSRSGATIAGGMLIGSLYPPLGTIG